MIPKTWFVVWSLASLAAGGATWSLFRHFSPPHVARDAGVVAAIVVIAAVAIAW